MATRWFVIFLCSSLALSVCGLGINLESLEDDENPNEDRTLIIGATANVPFNATQLATIVGLLAAALLPLLGLIALCALAFGTLLYQSSSGGYESSSSYGSTYRALGMDQIDWEKFTIIDWVSMGEEVFRKFDPSNIECQKRIICELHQNVKEFGTLASKMVNLFGYLKYLDLFGLPETIKRLSEEYQDAADRGRSLNRDCGDIYTNCEFSIKTLHDKYSGNEIQ